jgi:hypothetical protein
MLLPSPSVTPPWRFYCPQAPKLCTLEIQAIRIATLTLPLRLSTLLPVELRTVSLDTLELQALRISTLEFAGKSTTFEVSY